MEQPGTIVVHRQRQELRLGITEQPLRRGVDRLDAPGGIERDEPCDHGPQHGGVTNRRSPSRESDVVMNLRSTIVPMSVTPRMTSTKRQMRTASSVGGAPGCTA